MTEQTDKLKVFISYSREDLPFAEQLFLSLKERGFEPLLDRHHIDAGEKWKERLHDLIFQSDSLVFVLSKHSARSPICGWEVETAESLGKRMFPVVPSPVGDVNPPLQISELQYIFFYSDPAIPGSSIDDGMTKLDRALRMNLAWFREATRMSERTALWIRSRRNRDHLLRGFSLEQAQNWLARVPTDSEVSPETLEFLTASAVEDKAVKDKRLKTERALRGARTVRKRIATYAAFALVFISVIAGIHIWLLSEERTWNTLRIWGLAKLGLYGGPEMIDLATVEDFPAEFEMESFDRAAEQNYVNTVHFSKPFAIGRYEITFDEYGAYTFDKGLDQPDDRDWGAGLYPIINVSWDDIQGYIDWLKMVTGKPFRLPSESEWEFAARAGTKTEFWWGDEIGENRANCDGCGGRLGGKQTLPVGSFEANAFGLHDTAGNVFEWVEDCWFTAYEKAPSDGSAWLSDDEDCYWRVIRGGSWSNPPSDLRSASRYINSREVRDELLGFRLAQDLPD